MKRGGYRTVYDIMYDILSYLEEHNMRKTDFFYIGRISYIQFKKIFPILMGSHLITHNKESNTYAITDNGKQYKMHYDKIKELTSNSIKNI